MKIAPAIIGLSLFIISTSAFAEEPTPAKAFLERSVVLDDIVGGTYASGVGTGPLFSLAWFTIASSKSDSGGTQTVSTSFGVAPSADFFVGVGGLSVGGRLEIVHENLRTSTNVDRATMHLSSTSRSFAPRVGWAFPVSDHIVLWPRLEVEFGNGDSTISSTASPETTTESSHIEVSGELALVFPIQRHVAFSLGPRFSYGSTKRDDVSGGDHHELGSVRGALRLAF